MASVIHALYLDKKISNWATTTHPVCGSDQNAANFSTGFHEVLKYEAYGTILLTPPFDVWYKTKGAISFTPLIQKRERLITSSEVLTPERGQIKWMMKVCHQVTQQLQVLEGPSVKKT